MGKKWTCLLLKTIYWLIDDIVRHFINVYIYQCIPRRKWSVRSYLPWVCHSQSIAGVHAPVLGTDKLACHWELSVAPQFLLLSVSTPIVIYAVKKLYYPVSFKDWNENPRHENCHISLLLFLSFPNYVRNCENFWFNKQCEKIL